jgi:hypothetical protein
LGVRGNSKYHCAIIKSLISCHDAHYAIQTVAFGRLPLRKPNGSKITSGNLITPLHSNLLMLLALRASKRRHHCEERSVPTKTMRRTQRVRALVMCRSETLWS